MRESKINVPCVRVDELPFEAPAGHTVVYKDGDQTVINFGCPCGCGAHYGGKGWNVTENEGKLSSTPSFGCYPTKRGDAGPDGNFHWHGFLTNGVFTEC